MNLSDFIRTHAKTAPHSLAIQGPDGSLTYGDLDQLANCLAHALAHLGVQRGDRIGIWLEKTTSAVAVMQSILRLRAIYVPLDPLSPAARIRTIIQDCGIKTLVTTEKRAKELGITHFQDLVCLYLKEDESLRSWYDCNAFPISSQSVGEQDENEIAYILYTSGSTGKPKGVCISHRNALAFVRWAAEEIQATSRDRFANHAPFHFDLSVFDLYVAFLTGASVFLIPDGVASIPQKLVEFLEKEKPTIWYSVPSVLILMMEQGNLFNMPFPSLRCILYAGEAFPIKYLRKLYQRWQHIRLLNFYGPTETNVCVFYEINHLYDAYTYSVPIGKSCSGDQVWARKEDGTIAQVGEEGELMVTGPTVMIGYWGQPEHGGKPYATGDLVRLQHDGNYLYLGRRDHMVKVRGHRIEPGEIEAILEQHHAIREAAVIVSGEGLMARLLAVLVLTNEDDSPSLLEIKRHCAEHLPRYMIVDALRVLPTLPRTRNGKIDRLQLYNAFHKQSKEI